MTRLLSDEARACTPRKSRLNLEWNLPPFYPVPDRTPKNRVLTKRCEPSRTSVVVLRAGNDGVDDAKIRGTLSCPGTSSTWSTQDKCSPRRRPLLRRHGSSPGNSC